MKTKEKIIGVVLVVFLLVVVLIGLPEGGVNPLGQAPSGLPATVATSSTITVGPQEKLVWFDGPTSLTETPCAARIISTQAAAITISFSGTSSSTATTTSALSTVMGTIQAASTTVAYDSGLYGCRRLGIHGTGGTSTITITETR